MRAAKGGRGGKGGRVTLRERDRKSTRLNSSHSQISYAVFCLKKKNQRDRATFHLQIHFRVSIRRGRFDMHTIVGTVPSFVPGLKHRYATSALLTIQREPLHA